MSVVKIKCHKKTGVNLNLFMNDLGFKTFWNNINSDLDELVVVTKTAEQTKFVKAVGNEVEKTGFVPYHFALTYKSKGKKLDQDETKVSFEGFVIPNGYQKFNSINGEFWLIGYCDGTLNYLQKKYIRGNEDETVIWDSETELLVTGRMKAQIKGYKGESIILMNYVRVKQNVRD